MSSLVVYEQPLNERTRTLLRLEHLLRQMAHYMEGATVWDSRAVLTHLIDVLAILARSDLKSEVLKELDRHTMNLSRMKQSPGVDHERLAEVLNELNALSEALYAQKGQTGAELRQNEFFKGIMQRSTIPGGTCAFDLPAYHFWLQKPLEDRRQDLERWLSPFTSLGQAVELILLLTRNSDVPTQEFAPGGFFQQSLDPNLPCQLIRVSLPQGSPYFAEISGGRHRFTIRFMQIDQDWRTNQTEEDVQFGLTRCVI